MECEHMRALVALLYYEEATPTRDATVSCDPILSARALVILCFKILKLCCQLLIATSEVAEASRRGAI